jgi:hypothetical protein
MSASPTTRILERLRKDGWTAQVVERFNAHAKVRQELFGFINVRAIPPGEPPLAVPATTSRNPPARLVKALALPALRSWLAAGCRFEVHGWSKKGLRGKWKLWTLTRRPVRLSEVPRPERPLTLHREIASGGISWTGERERLTLGGMHRDEGGAESASASSQSEPF